MEKTLQKRSDVFIIGAILVIFWSAVIGFFNVAVLFWFGIPFLGLLVGIVLVWVSKENVKTKLLLTFVPIPIILAAFYVFYLVSPKAEPETFLIPRNFRGQCEIIFNEPCGQSTPYENGRRIYRIPDNGVLITNANQTFGFIDRKFYLLDENGNKTELPEFNRSKFEEEEGRWYWTISKTKLSKNTVGIMWHPSPANYEIFAVSDYQSLENDSDEIKEEKRKSFQNMSDSLLKECRKTR